MNAVADEPKLLAPLDGYPDEPVYEVIDGVVTELPETARTSLLANQILLELGSRVRARHLGAVVHKVLFDLVLPDRYRRRRPDVAFVSYERWPADRRIPGRDYHWSVVPELVVKIVIPMGEVPVLADSLRDYFDAGVRCAWVVDPQTRSVKVFNSLDRVTTYQEPADIDGGDILPGIRVPVVSLLPPRP